MDHVNKDSFRRLKVLQTRSKVQTLKYLNSSDLNSFCHISYTKTFLYVKPRTDSSDLVKWSPKKSSVGTERNNDFQTDVTTLRRRFCTVKMNEVHDNLPNGGKGHFRRHLSP